MFLPLNVKKKKNILKYFVSITHLQHLIILLYNFLLTIIITHLRIVCLISLEIKMFLKILKDLKNVIFIHSLSLTVIGMCSNI